ncbi:putative RNA-binding protein EIF1AD-like protein [Gaertneriomyces semiglobifer]|nr:putative RNA-binding protein EIF1AD-like protein [Gaertneriomyces semiglobifer]
MGRKTTQQVLQSHPVPTNPAQYIAKVIENRGTSHEVVLSRDRAGEKVLVSLPTRFRKSIWIKKGNYAIIEIDSQPTTKIVGEIVHVLLPDNVKYLKSENLWPEEFLDAPDDTITKPESVPRSAQSDGSDDSDDDDDLFVNTNRPVYDDEESEEED